MCDGKNNYYDRIKFFKDKPNGTYDFETKKEVKFDSGYQITFYNKNVYYTKNKYNRLTNKLAKQTKSKIYAGVYGEPETSFHTEKKNLAMRIAIRYHQESIWDWKSNTEIKNPQY